MDTETANSAERDGQPADRQVLCKFTTKLPERYAVPQGSITVPASLRRYGLSQVINHLLSLEQPVPFDFLVAGEALRSTLFEHLASRSISTEAALEVEYFLAALPPTQGPSSSAQDWISCLAHSPQGTQPAPLQDSLLYTGGYDGYVQLWDFHLNPLGRFRAHNEPISDIALLTIPVDAAQATHSSKGVQATNGAAKAPTTAGSCQQLLVTCAKDCSAAVWKIPDSLPPRGQPQQPGSARDLQSCAEQVATLAGHQDALQCLAPPASEQGPVVGGSWDSSLYLWTLGADLLDRWCEAGAAVGLGTKAAKKSKLNPGGAAAKAQPLQLEAAAALVGHTQCVSSVAWSDAGSKVVSGSWDHSVRRWDLEGQKCVDQHIGSRAVYTLCLGGAESHVVAFGGADRAIWVWDMRARAGEGLGVRRLGYHADWVAAMEWHPVSEHILASASYDGGVKVWDIRGAVPLASMAQHTDKALCVGWWGGDKLVSGGADCKVQSYAFEEGWRGQLDGI